MQAFQQTLTIEDSNENGWVHSATLYGEINIYNSPGVVIPPSMPLRDLMYIINDGIELHISTSTCQHDERISAVIVGAAIPLTIVQSMIGRTLSDVIQVPQLVGHPLMSLRIEAIEYLKPDALDEGEVGFEMKLAA